MTTIVKRITKGSTLTVAELDANVANLNNTKLEVAGGTLTGLPVLANQDVDIISPVYPTTKPSLNLDFTRGQLDPRVTFARNSTAAYYDGKSVAKAEENLFSYSQDFGNAVWNKTSFFNGTLTTNTAVAPDGTTTACSLVENTASGYHQVYRTSYVPISLTAVTFSVYVKWASGTRNVGLSIQGTGGNTSTVIFDNTGTYVTTVGSGGETHTSTSVGNGWYRFTQTITSTNGLAACYIELFNGTTEPYQGDGTSGVFLWGAQLEQRSSVTAYTPTTTAPITNYIPVLKFAPANVPRFDYDPITGKPLGLLIEEGRSNLALQSSFFNTSPWGNVGFSLGSNAQIAPDGSLTTFKLIPLLSSSTPRYLYQPASYSAGNYTFSLYAKKAELNTLCISLGTGPSNVYAVFDLLNGIVSSTDFGITPSIVPVGNGWYRCSATVTKLTTNQYILISNSNSFASGDGYSGIYIWGAQLEAGSFATSYIPTTTTAVSRFADQASMVGSNFSSWYNIPQGSFYADFDVLSLDASAKWVLSVSVDPLATNSFLDIYLTSTSTITSVHSRYFTSYTPSVLAANLNSNIANSFNIKTAFSHTFGSQLALTNGIPAASYNVEQPLTGILARLNIGFGYTAPTGQLNGHIRKLTYYPKALSQPELQALTS